MIEALRYAIGEALESLWRGRESGVLSTATIALALFVLGGFLLVTTNLERLGLEWGRAAEMSVYLKDDVTPGQRRAIENLLASGDVVERREYLSKGDALIRFRQTFAELASTLDELGDNPLPASYELRLQAGGARDGALHLAAQLRSTAGVADVRDDRQWLDRLLAAITIVRRIGLMLGLILTLGAALTVANVVRLSLVARRDELDIMQLVGAPHAYIRGPFVMEGVLQGGIGALAALVALAVGFYLVRSRYLLPLASVANLSGVSFLSAGVGVALVLGGMAVGCLGGFVAAWSGR